MYRFVMGELDEPSSQVLSDHVEQCSQCNDIITMEDQVLLAWLRRGLKSPPPADDPEILRAIQIAKRAGIKQQQKDTPSLMGGPEEMRDYQILEQIGAGGMGIVYRALHKRLKREVVIKVLNKKMSDDPSAVLRFEREMEAIGSLNHAHIVAAHDAGEVEGTHYLVMEYVDGVNVSQLSKRLKQLSVADACEIVRQTAEALEFAHKQALIHRDIKPANLMITQQGVVKVLDLGLARLLNQDKQEAELTTTGQIMGTVEYMAPEQAESMMDVDYRADIYSLGVTLYKLLAGTSPYRFEEQEPVWKRLQKITSQPTIPLTEIRADLPAPLVELVSRMLERKPESRPASMAEIAVCLKPLCEGSHLEQLISADASEYADLHNTSQTILESSLNGTRFAPDSRPEKKTVLEPASDDNRGDNQKRTLLASLGGLGLIAVLSVIIFLQSASGSVEIRLADGVSDDIQINVLQAGQVIKVADQKSGWKIELSTGEYQLQLNGSSDRIQLDKHQIRVLRGQSEVVSITRKPETTLARQEPGQPSVLKKEQPDLTADFKWPAKTKTSKIQGILNEPAVFPEIPDWQIPLTGVHKQARFSPDGKYYLSSDGNNSPILTLTQVATGEELQTHQSIRFNKWTADSWYSWSPDSRSYCLVTNQGVTISSIDPTRKAVQIPINIPLEGRISSLAWRPDGRDIAVALYHENHRSQIRLYHPDGTPGDVLIDQKLMRTGQPQPAYWKLAWSPDSHNLIACSTGKNAVLHIDTQTNQIEPWLQDHPFSIHQAVWSPDGKTIAFSDDKQILLTSPQGDIQKRHTLANLWAHELLWSPDSESLLVLSNSSYLIPLKGKPVPFRKAESNLRDYLLAATPGRDGQRILALDNLLELQWYDFTTGEAQAVVEPPSATVPVWDSRGDLPVQNMVWNRRGTQLATFSRYNTTSRRSHIQLWNADGTGAETVSIPGSAARVDFDPRGDLLTIGTIEGRLFQWSGQPDQPPAEILAKVYNNLHYVRPEISFSHDGRYIACKSGVYDRDQNKITWTPPYEKEGRYGLITAWSPVENVFAVVSGTDGIVSLHKPDGTLVGKVSPEKPANPGIMIIRWSPDGKWIAVPQQQSDSVAFYSRDLKQKLQIPKPESFEDSHASFWNWSSDSQYFMGLGSKAGKSDRALVIFSPDKQQARISQYQFPDYTTALLSASPAGNLILLVQKMGTLCIHKLDNQQGPEIGPVLWKGQMFADGSSASFTPSGELLSESQEGSQNLRCLVREADGALTPWRYSEFQRRVFLSPGKVALMSVLSRGGQIRSTSSGELLTASCNIQGLTTIESLSEPVLIELTQGVTNLQGLENLKVVPEGTRLNFSDNRECTDKILSQIQGATALVGLNLTGTAVTSDCLPTLQSLSELRELNLSKTGIRDETVAGLTSLKELRSLEISNTLISDRSIDALLELPQLQSLNLTNCQISEKAIKRFRDARPDCQVIWSH
ncbi:protein kinase domain-containing protein [Gimesia maris]|uniref:protein kinase domain-containing protein n=1 Tax=Gimesia maris TaxID=122 RepID=UPI0030DC9C57